MILETSRRKTRPHARIAGLVSLFLLITSSVNTRADNWPCWRGPEFSGISREPDWLSEWPKEGPPLAWKTSVGTGFSSVVVSENHLFTIGNRDNQDTVYCLNASTGAELWRYSYDSDLGDKFFEGGPTSTPTVDGDSVYTLGRWGLLICFEKTTGKVIWSKNVHEETSVRIPGWGFASSPRIQGNFLLLNVGEAGMAVDKRDGLIIWQSANQDAGYSSAVPFQNAGEWHVALGSGKSFLAVNLRTGVELWRHRWLTRYGVNSADPIVKGNRVFISSGYGKGAALLEMQSDTIHIVWQNKNMRNQLNSSLLIDGHLYGFDGDAGSASSLRCISWDTGEIAWTADSIGTGGLMAAAGKLIVLSDKGELLIADASPHAFHPTARSQVLGGKCWTTPVLANGRIYCRNAAGDLVCVSVQTTQPDAIPSSGTIRLSNP